MFRCPPVKYTLARNQPKTPINPEFLTTLREILNDEDRSPEFRTTLAAAEAFVSNLRAELNPDVEVEFCPVISQDLPYDKAGYRLTLHLPDPERSLTTLIFKLLIDAKGDGTLVPSSDRMSPVPFKVGQLIPCLLDHFRWDDTRRLIAPFRKPKLWP